MNSNRHRKSRGGKSFVIRPASPKKTQVSDTDVERALNDAARAAHQSNAEALSRKNRFRAIWFQLHAMGACFSMGIYDRETLIQHLNKCSQELKNACANCHQHFQYEQIKIADASPETIERVIFDIHCHATSKSDVMYVPPDFEHTKDFYRCKVRQLVFTVMSGVDQSQ